MFTANLVFVLLEPGLKQTLNIWFLKALNSFGSLHRNTLFLEVNCILIILAFIQEFTRNDFEW